MAPLMCTPIEEVYGNKFGKTTEELVELQLKENQQCANNNKEYQDNLKYTEIAGINSSDSISPETINNSKFVKKMAWTDKDNSWPSSNNYNSIYSRFQNINPFNFKEKFGVPNSEKECMHQLVLLVKELVLILKIIMLILLLIFLVKILETKK